MTSDHRPVQAAECPHHHCPALSQFQQGLRRSRDHDKEALCLFCSIRASTANQEPICPAVEPEARIACLTQT